MAWIERNMPGIVFYITVSRLEMKWCKWSHTNNTCTHKMSDVNYSFYSTQMLTFPEMDVFFILFLFCWFDVGDLKHINFSVFFPWHRRFFFSCFLDMPFFEYKIHVGIKASQWLKYLHRNSFTIWKERNTWVKSQAVFCNVPTNFPFSWINERLLCFLRETYELDILCIAEQCGTNIKERNQTTHRRLYLLPLN